MTEISYFPNSKNCTIAIIGLGYVGLPLAIEFSKSKVSSKDESPINYKVIGFDINSKRVEDLLKGIDITKEIHPEELKNSNLTITSKEDNLICADVFIVTVPTPVDIAKKPDLYPIKSATELVANTLKKKNINNINRKKIFANNNL